jgi:transposase-like protein
VRGAVQSGEIVTHCICPYCKQETGVGTAGLFDTVLMSRKTCEKCDRDFLIVNDVPMTQEQYDRRVNDSGV